MHRDIAIARMSAAIGRRLQAPSGAWIVARADERAGKFGHQSGEFTDSSGDTFEGSGDEWAKDLEKAIFDYAAANWPPGLKVTEAHLGLMLEELREASIAATGRVTPICNPD